MKTTKTFHTAALAFACLLSTRSIASGYSEYENHRIWQLRLAAQQYAAQETQRKCEWTPKSPVTFSDQLPSDWHVSNERLFLRIMAMLRLDQNARAISLAIDDDESRTRTEAVDAGNLLALKSIISTYGFPTPEEVGEMGTHATLQLVAHADKDLDFQKSVALKMDDEVAKGVLPAMYPLILKTIRPQITGKPKNPINESSSSESSIASPLTHESPSECYNRNYQKSIDSYIRSRYKEAD